MAILDAIKKHFCNHLYEIDDVYLTGHRPGVLMVISKCTNCGDMFGSMHDLTETENPTYRSPHMEKLLIQLGYLKMKKGKLTFEPKPKKGGARNEP